MAQYSYQCMTNHHAVRASPTSTAAPAITSSVWQTRTLIGAP